jgi:hypothetical protein
MKRHLLVGNGINIQFGGPAYSSDFILKRIKYNSRLGKYDALFGGKITGKEIEDVFKGFVDIANGIIEKQYENVTDDPDTSEAIKDFQNRYTEKVRLPHEVMLEDWLLLVRVFFLVNSDLVQDNLSAVQGFEQLLLDAIYNDGMVQDLYHNMNKQVKRFLNEFDKIFTLNYDNNIELLTHRTVYHLHGDFSVLSNSENEENVLGYRRTKEGTTVWFPEMRHCYCNGLLNYSGRLKYKTAEDNHKAIVESEQYVERYQNDPSFIEDISKLDPLVAQMNSTKSEHPELKMETEYYFYELKEIEGQLEIIGMSPNNDAHIFDLILRNPRITKVVFYYFSEKERKFIEEHYPKDLFKCESVHKIWKSLNSNRKKYNCNYNVPDEGSDIIKALNLMSDDEVSFEEIKKKVNQVSQFDMTRLSKAVKEELQRRNPEHTSLNVDEFKKENSAISHIALQEGILPSVLYLICVMNFEKQGDK